MNIVRESSRVGGRWNPSVAPGLLAWLDPALRVTHVAGATSAWASRVGSVSGAQGTGSAKPTWSATALGGRPGLTFDGGDALTISGLSATAGPLLVVAAVLPTSSGASQTLLDAQTGRLVIATQDGVDASSVGYYDGAWRQAGAKAAGVQVLSWDLRTANGRVFRNGVLLGSALAHTQQALGGTITLGSQYTGAAFYTGVMGHVVILSSPTDALRKQVERYVGAQSNVLITA